MGIPFVSTAYREDSAARNGPFGPRDGSWIAIASLVERAARGIPGDRIKLLREAISLAVETIGGAVEVDRLATREWENHDRTESDALLLIADQIHYSGANGLSAALLDCLALADDSISTVIRGRILAKRARIDWKAGRIDQAIERCKYLDSIGRRSHSDELRARAAIGFVVINQMRGNYPEMTRCAKDAARYARRSQLRALRRDAHLGLMICGAVSRRLSDALVNGWAVYELSLGDAIEEAESLLNLAQALLDGGLAGQARAVFAALSARRLPPRLMLAALGGLALASATSGDEGAVHWAADKVVGIDRIVSPPFAFATALLECAVALQRVGARDRASRLRIDALRLAETHHFHEVSYRADDLDGQLLRPFTGDNEPLTTRAAKVAAVLAQMEPERLPTRVTLETAIV